MTSLEALASEIDERERAAPGLKPDNQARVVFLEGAPRERRPLALVYLHGFTASQAEGDPAHRALAQACGAHLYLNRLHDHGSDEPMAMAGATPQAWRDDADAALQVGLALGERVVLVATSMGGSLALDLAATYPDKVAALVAWSPGIRVFDEEQLRAATLLEGPVVPPGDRTPYQRQYWSSVVHSDAYRAIARLFVERMQPANLARVTCPVLMGAWDGGVGDSDTLTSVAAMREAFTWLGTPASARRFVSYTHAAHVLANPNRSPAAERVLADALAFLAEHRP
ncbi:alpha/beta hydrolase [Luteibacter aegosomatissinici]|uniref:alpha/beta hydrolase n=1 Tax=Luteibacter aegosomatissinici TaxID=2911539 RepID=UPI001FFB9044|nr:alpha/beta fold hydrolase [Luteibacter aegosomatissinici]UPG95274.1 alpha/beta fold hydrolase [Luteibacter aegosomatissinici]